MSSYHYTGVDALEVMSKYAPNHNQSIEKLLIKNLKFDESSQSLKILEFGAGKGEFILRFISRKNLELFAVEIDPKFIKDLSNKIKVFRSIDEVPDGLDCIYLIDVLEHLENDQFILNCFYKKLKKGGRIFIYVPARMELFSSFDKKIGHFRRYEIDELKDKTEKAGFTIEIIRYHELLGYAASWLNKHLINKEDLNPSAVKFYDRFLVPITNFMEKFMTVPVGKSIYLSAIRKE